MLVSSYLYASLWPKSIIHTKGEPQLRAHITQETEGNKKFLCSEEGATMKQRAKEIERKK